MKIKRLRIEHELTQATLAKRVRISRVHLAGATSDTFLAGHQPCFQSATIGYGVGSERV